MVLLAVALLAGAASFAATQHWAFAHGAPGHRRQSAPLTPKPVSAASLERLRAAASEQQVAARAPFVSGTHLLLPAAPRLEHAGLRPIVAPAAILVDASTGAVLWAKRPHERRPIASTTKIMTGVLALEHPGQIGAGRRPVRPLPRRNTDTALTPKARMANAPTAARTGCARPGRTPRGRRASGS